MHRVGLSTNGDDSRLWARCLGLLQQQRLTLDSAQGCLRPITKETTWTGDRCFLVPLSLPAPHSVRGAPEVFPECTPESMPISAGRGEGDEATTLRQPAEPCGVGRKVGGGCNFQSFDLLPYSRINYSPRSPEQGGRRGAVAIVPLVEGTAVSAQERSPIPGAQN